MRILVFLPNWIGDATMAVPLYRALREIYGREASIVGVVRPGMLDLFGGSDWFDELWPFHKRGKSRETSHFSLLSKIRAGNFDLALLLNNSLRTALLAYFGRCKRRMGNARFFRDGFLTDPIRKQPERRNLRGKVLEPMVYHYLRFAERLAAECFAAEDTLAIVPPVALRVLPHRPDEWHDDFQRTSGMLGFSPRLEWKTREEDERSAGKVLADLGLRTDGRIVFLNFSGVPNHTKLWPHEHQVVLARLITDRLDRDVLFLCGPGDEQRRAREAAAACGRARVFSMADQPLDFGTSKALMRHGELIVSNDTGPGHLATAMGLPMVAIYGPFSYDQSENPTVDADRLFLDCDCLGCHAKRCPRGDHRCMRDMTAERVFPFVERRLK